MEGKRMDDIHKKAPGFLGEGVRILRDGLKEAGRLLGATADATRLHIEKEHRTIGTHRDYHRLGAEVYRAARDDAGAVEIKLTKQMKDIIGRIKSAESEIEKHREQLSHLSVVNMPKKRTASTGAKTKRVPRRSGRKAGSARGRKRSKK
jgi:hypothetical protein